MAEQIQETFTRLTPEERAARWAELRARPLMSGIYARCKNPNVYCKWVRKDDPNDIAYHETMGFRTVVDDPKKPREARRYTTAMPCNGEGKYINGDVILMECPRDDYEFYVHEGTELSRMQLNSGKDRFINEAARQDVPAFERDLKTGQVIKQSQRGR